MHGSFVDLHTTCQNIFGCIPIVPTKGPKILIKDAVSSLRLFAAQLGAAESRIIIQKIYRNIQYKTYQRVISWYFMLSPAHNPALCQAMPSPAGPSGPGGAEVAPKVPWSGRSISIHPSDCFLSQISPNLSLILGFDAYSDVDWGTSVSASMTDFCCFVPYKSKALWCAFGCLRGKRSSCKPLVCLRTEPPASAPPWPESR